MTKSDVIKVISKETGIEKLMVEKIVLSFMHTIKVSMSNNKNIYFRGFGSFLVKKRAKKIGRNISKNTAVIIEEHFTPTFKPSKEFMDKIKKVS